MAGDSGKIKETAVVFKTGFQILIWTFSTLRKKAQLILSWSHKCAKSGPIPPSWTVSNSFFPLPLMNPKWKLRSLTTEVYWLAKHLDSCPDSQSSPWVQGLASLLSSFHPAHWSPWRYNTWLDTLLLSREVIGSLTIENDDKASRCGLLGCECPWIRSENGRERGAPTPELSPQPPAAKRGFTKLFMETTS